ncbi:MAG: response regulator [Anaerolineae bacterium]|nr:response regulator [Anaerolineae bacterium]
MSPAVLIIEDEPEVLTLLTRMLQREDCQIIPALGGENALQALQQYTPDIILLDLAMPGINGLDLLEAIQGMPHLSNTKVIVITARPMMVEEARQYNVVARIFLKPVRAIQLLHTVHELLDTTA